LANTEEPTEVLLFANTEEHAEVLLVALLVESAEVLLFALLVNLLRYSSLHYLSSVMYC
jgi:hypothetical protein